MEVEVVWTWRIVNLLLLNAKYAAGPLKRGPASTGHLVNEKRGPAISRQEAGARRLGTRATL